MKTFSRYKLSWWKSERIRAPQTAITNCYWAHYAPCNKERNLTFTKRGSVESTVSKQLQLHHMITYTCRFVMSLTRTGSVSHWLIHGISEWLTRWLSEWLNHSLSDCGWKLNLNFHLETERVDWLTESLTHSQSLSLTVTHCQCHCRWLRVSYWLSCRNIVTSALISVQYSHIYADFVRNTI